jgi:hypothetical protein
MTKDDGKIQELACLAEQFSILRNELKEMNRKLNKMEKRLAAAFPQYKEAANPLPKADAADTSRENLLKIFEGLLKAAKGRDDIAFAQKTKEYPKETIVALALELGVPGGKKMGMKKALDGIKNRLQETAVLAQKDNRRDQR